MEEKKAYQEKSRLNYMNGTPKSKCSRQKLKRRKQKLK